MLRPFSPFYLVAEETEEARAASISATLRSSTRETGPRVVHREPRHLYVPQSPRSKAAAEREHTEVVREMFAEMSDIGLKPVVVYHNLAVAELYEHSLK